MPNVGNEWGFITGLSLNLGRTFHYRRRAAQLRHRRLPCAQGRRRRPLRLRPRHFQLRHRKGQFRSLPQLPRKRVRSKLWPFLVIATLLLAGCGGNGEEGSTAKSPPASTEVTQPGTSPASPHTGSTKGRRDFGPVSEPSSAQVGSNPGHDSARGTAAFEAKGGDNSIQESGSEGSGSEFDQAAAALHGYLDARAAGEWGGACSFITAGLITSMRQLATGERGKATCAKLLASLSSTVPPPILREAAVADVGALRVDGDSAFLLFHGAGGVDYFMPMAREGDKWKVAAISASALG